MFIGVLNLDTETKIPTDNTNGRYYKLSYALCFRILQVAINKLFKDTQDCDFISSVGLL